MFRTLFRKSRGIRVPLQNGQIDVQRVAVTRKPRPVFPRVLTTVALTYCVARTINHFYPETAHGSKSEANEARDGQRSHDGASVWPNTHARATPQTTGSKEQNEVIHLMLPIWIRRRPSPPYTADDPTWNSFRALREDTKRWAALQSEVAKAVRRSIVVGQYRNAYQSIGPVKQVVGNIKLAPPLRPPNVYEVPCIFLEPGNVRYDWRPLPDTIGQKMERVFHPIVFARAFFAGLCEFSWASYAITKARVTDQINALNPSTPGRTATGKTLTEDEKAHQRLQSSVLSEDRKKVWLPFLRGEYGEREGWQRHRDVVSATTYRGAIESACVVFRSSWSQHWARSTQMDAQDRAYVVGHLEFVGERATLYVSFVAFYSPEGNSIIGSPALKGVWLVPNFQNWHTKGTTGEETEGKKTLLPPNVAEHAPAGTSGGEQPPAPPLKPSSPAPDAPNRETSAGDKGSEK